MASILSRNKLFGSISKLTPTLIERKKPIAPIINTFDIKEGTPILPSKITTNKSLPEVAIVNRETRQIQTIPPDDFKKYGKFLLEGEYTQNSVSFDKFSFDDILGLDTIKFEFILKLINASDVRYYTSTQTLTDLIEFNQDNAPYFSHEILKPSSIVTINVKELLTLLSQQKSDEAADKTNVFFNLFLDTLTNKLDYTKLVEYIDWVVSKPPTNYDDRIIPVGNLGIWASDNIIPASNVELTPSSEPVTTSNEIKQTVAISNSNPSNTTSTISSNEFNQTEPDLPIIETQELADVYFGYGGGSMSS